MPDCFTIEVVPAGLRFAATAGQTVMAAANAAGVFWPTLCGGEARCLACVFAVSSEDGFDPADDEEVQALAKAGRTPDRFRLACRARVGGDLTIVQRKARLAQPMDRLPFA